MLGSTCAIEAKIELGSNRSSNPIRNTYHNTTSQKKSRTFLSLKSIYPLMPSPTNKWIRPNAMEYISIRMGSFKGTNQSAFTRPPSGTSTWKKVRATTSMASPKYPPKRIPHIKVETPQYINILMDFFKDCSIRGNFFSITKQPRNITSPYAASDSINPKKNT